MSSDYRNTLIRKLADQAMAERAGAKFYGSWIAKAPGANESRQMAELALEETDHWLRVVRLLEDLGVEESSVRTLASNGRFIVLTWLMLGPIRWLDVVMMMFLVDRAGYYLVEDFTQSSYAPWREMATEILREEESHPQLGANLLRDHVERFGPARAQRALAKWWRVALNMCGPSRNQEHYIRLGLKTRTSDERRKVFCLETSREIEKLGLRVPQLMHESYPFF